MITTAIKNLDFKLPKKLECALPSELRNLERDEVRLLVSHYQTDEISHHQFKNLVDVLIPGDVLVVNTSGTLKAALDAKNKQGQELKVHISNSLEKNQYLIELRTNNTEGSKRFNDAKEGDTLQLKNGGTIKLIAPYYKAEINHLQLWIADLNLEISLKNYLNQFGNPIKYSYNKAVYPQSYYQTVFANEMGSAEMPSAGRAFSPELVLQLILKGIQIVPILLHTGVASLEINEKPYDEFYQIPEFSAQQINQARKEGRRIIAVGTTAIRAIETLAHPNGYMEAGSGWTNVFITPERGLHVTDGLITGFHEPKASHLLMLETLSGRAHLDVSYTAAIEAEYLWHEFGDLHLLLP